MNMDAAKTLHALLILFVAVLLALAVGQGAKKCGRSAVWWTVLALIINPLFAWIALAVVTARQTYKQPRPGKL